MTSFEEVIESAKVQPMKIGEPHFKLTECSEEIRAPRECFTRDIKLAFAVKDSGLATIQAFDKRGARISLPKAIRLFA